MFAGSGVDLSSTFVFANTYCCMPCCSTDQFYVSKHGRVEPWDEMRGLPEDAKESHYRLREIAIGCLMDLGLGLGQAKQTIDKEINLLTKANFAEPVNIIDLERIAHIINGLKKNTKTS